MKSYRHTIAHSVLTQSKVIASATGIPSNDLVRTCLGVSGDIDEDVNRNFFHAMEEEIHAITGSYSVSIINRPKPNRLSGKCYINAFHEWKQTGNEPVIGWEGTLCGRYVSVVPHAFNVDKDGTYYDTANNYLVKGKHDRPCWIRCSGEEAKKWLTQFAEFFNTNDTRMLDGLPLWCDVWGGLGVIIHSDNHAYMVRTKGLTEDNIDKENSFYKVIDCSA